MKRYFTRKQLLKIGFATVGDDSQVSLDAKFYSISGEIGSGVRIDASAVITGNIFLGDQCHISPFVFMSGVGGGIKLDYKVGIGSHSALFTKSDQYRNEHTPSKVLKFSGQIHIMNNTICGHNVTVMPGTTIGSNCRIGAKCIVSGFIDENQYLVSYAARYFPSMVRPFRNE